MGAHEHIATVCALGHRSALDIAKHRFKRFHQVTTKAPYIPEAVLRLPLGGGPTLVPRNLEERRSFRRKDPRQLRKGALVIGNLLDHMLHGDHIEAARSKWSEVNQIHLEVDEAHVAGVARVAVPPFVDTKAVPAPCLKMFTKDPPTVRSHVEEGPIATGLKKVVAHAKETTVTLE